MIATGVAENIADWFYEHERPLGSITADVFILHDKARKSISDFLAREMPSCYISEEDIKSQVARLKCSAPEVVANKVADPGAVMAGDFGEILTLFFLGASNHGKPCSVKKWRYKQDRNKAAPHSDVILLYCEDSANPKVGDYLICAEVKVKSTPSKTYRPIEASVKGYEADRTGRLAKTLAWLREKAFETEGPETIKYIERFSKVNIEITYDKKHRAVAVVDKNFVDDELAQITTIPDQGDSFKVVVLGLEQLKDLYEECFTRAVREARIG
ncbi:Hachiman antiphage defense system protein HamA [Roseicyclus marinus]|uniref:Hachiman antiphage defense system protein HamA n=1 Tax=Roseicyclus marinus TaxID=2161673 RepID=UPI00240F8308|nr:Hachiman antiphage defense system protein HamA [Roseicyclus marinus]MDG3043125.1 SAVED domain-containing protein [Roseicyclus marinus]